MKTACVNGNQKLLMNMLEYLCPSRGAVHLWGHAMAEEASSFPGGAVVPPASAARLFGYVLMF